MASKRFDRYYSTRSASNDSRQLERLAYLTLKNKANFEPIPEIIELHSTDGEISFARKKLNSLSLFLSFSQSSSSYSISLSISIYLSIYLSLLSIRAAVMPLYDFHPNLDL